MSKLVAVALVALTSVGALAYSQKPLEPAPVDEAKVQAAMDARLHQLLLDLRARKQS